MIYPILRKTCPFCNEKIEHVVDNTYCCGNIFCRLGDYERYYIEYDADNTVCIGFALIVQIKNKYLE